MKPGFFGVTILFSVDQNTTWVSISTVCANPKAIPFNPELKNQQHDPAS